MPISRQGPMQEKRSRARYYGRVALQEGYASAGVTWPEKSVEMVGMFLTSRVTDTDFVEQYFNITDLLMEKMGKRLGETDGGTCVS